MGVARGNIKTTLVIDGEQAYFQTMTRLKDQQKQIRSEMNLLSSTYNQNTTAVQKLKDREEILSKQIQQQKAIVEKLNADYENAVEQSGENSTETQKLATQYNNACAQLNRFENELEDVKKQLSNNGEALKVAGTKITDFGNKYSEAGEKITNAGKKMSIASGIVVAAAGTAANAAIDYESAFAGVKKTVDATDEEFDALYESILDLSTEIPSTAEEIAGVAEIAGQLGIETDKLLEFSEVMIGLGQATNLSSEEAASALAKFANVTGMSADDYERLGSVIVQLGNNYATTEADIVSMATRLASTGTITGLSQSQIMAIATALSSVGIEAEAGGSAVSKVLKNMQVAVETNSESLKDFASVSNMSVSEFKELWEKDAVAALGAFVEGLNDTERNGKSAVAVLNDMDITEIRMSNALLALSTSNGILTETVETANLAWDENAALQEEVNKRNETLASKLQVVKNMLNKVAIEFGEELMPYIEKGAKKISDLAESFSDLSDEEKKNIIKIGAIVVAAGPLLTIVGKTTTGAGKLITTIGRLTTTIGKVKTGEAVFQFKEFSNVLKDVSGSEQSAVKGAASLIGTNAAVVAGVVAASAAVAGLALAYRELEYGNKATRETMSVLSDSIDDFKDKLEEASGDISAIKEGLDFDDKNAELESQYSDIQERIIQIASTASEERRALTATEKEELQELFDQLNLISEKEIELYQDTQDAISASIEAENQMTDEQAAEYIKKIENTANEAKEKIQSRYDNRLVLLQQQYEKEGTLTSEEYENEIKKLQEWRDNELSILQSSSENNMNAISEKILQNGNGYQSMLDAFKQYNADMTAAQEEYNTQSQQTESDNWSAVLGNYISYLINRKNLNDEFAEEFLTNNSETLANYLSTIESMLEAGETLSTENEEMLRQIIAAYDDLPESAKGPWKEAMDNIIALIDEADLKKKGEDTASSFNEGIESGFNLSRPRLVDATKKNAQAIPEITRKTLKINSPSKVAVWIAEGYDEGLVLGLEKKKQDVLNTVSDLSEDIIKSTNLSGGADIPISVKLAESYEAALAGSAAVQSFYQQTYVNNNNSSINSYYSTSKESEAGKLIDEIKDFKNQFMRLASNEGSGLITDRQAGRIIKRCLKSVST